MRRCGGSVFQVHGARDAITIAYERPGHSGRRRAQSLVDDRRPSVLRRLLGGVAESDHDATQPARSQSCAQRPVHNAAYLGVGIAQLLLLLRSGV